MSEEQAQGANEQSQGDNSLVAELKSEAAQRRIENKDLKEQLDTLIAERKTAKEDAAAKQGEFKELYENTSVERDELRTQLDAEKEKNKVYIESEEERFKEILKNVPDNFKDQLSDDIPLKTRIALAEKLAQTKPTAPNPRLPGEGAGNLITRQAFDALSPADKSKYIAGGGVVKD